jgi:tyrosine-specific transport protein
MLNELDSKVFGGTMLIAGTTIGAAMLAMPILTGIFGFLGTLIIILCCWLFMYWIALLILEACLHFEDNVSFITLAKDSLGKGAAIITWVFFLLLFYSLLAAYLSGSGSIVIDALESLFAINLPPFFDIMPLLVLFCPFIYFGLSIVDRLNRYLMVGMLMTYLSIMFWLVPDVQLEQLLYLDFSYSLVSFSIIITSFGYHVIIPTLVNYLERDVRRIKICLFYGSFIPLIIYVLWEFAMLGVLSIEGPNGLLHAFKHDVPLVKLLRTELNSDFIAALARSFSIFAIITSFLGVAQGLFDFLKDGIKAHTHKRRLSAFLLTFVPPVLLVIFFQSGFIGLLEYAGALISVIMGIIPILIVWSLRKRKDRYIEYRAPGNKHVFVIGIVFFTLIIVLVILRNIGIIA